MTATELYEIVKDHPDVWGNHLHWNGYGFCRRRVGLIYPTTLADQEPVENELLGLGVKWLASGGGTSLSYITAMIVNRKGEAAVEAWEERRGDVSVRCTNILAAVYAAIAYVKENTKGKE